MIGFQPYETFELLVESGGIERAGNLLVAACEAFARRPRPALPEMRQFEALAHRLFATAPPSACQQAARHLMAAEHLTPALEQLAIDHAGEDLALFVAEAPSLSPGVLADIAAKKDPAICALMAARSDLTRDVAARLFAINSRAVYRALAANRAVDLDGPKLAALVRAAGMDHQVGASLAERDDFDKALLSPAFFTLDEPARLDVLRAFADRRIPESQLKPTFEQVSVVTAELTQALMKLFYANRRPEITRLFTQISSLDEVLCGEIAHDKGGAALLALLRAFGCQAAEGLKVLVHATEHEPGRSRSLSEYARLFDALSVDSMIYLMSVWRGVSNPATLNRPEFQPAARPHTRPAAVATEAGEIGDVGRAMAAVQRIVGAGAA